MNALDRSMAHCIHTYGYFVCSIPTGYAVADPLDEENGFYLETKTIEEAYDEMQELGLLTISQVGDY